MDYAGFYQRLIDRARGRVLTEYCERHHVLPLCMGGGDESENLVDLTPEEHFVAHQLLVKMHPGVKGLVHAALLMAKKVSGNKAFGWLRRRKAMAMLGNPSNLGKKLPPLSPERVASLRGNKFALGYRHTPETIARISAKSRGRKHTESARAKMSAANKGKTISLQQRAALSVANRGKHPSAEARAKMSAASIGNKRRLGIPHSAGARAKMSVAQRGRKHSADTKAKIAAANTGKQISVETRAKIAASLRGRPVIRSPEGAARIAAAARRRMLSDANPMKKLRAAT